MATLLQDLATLAFRRRRTFVAAWLGYEARAASRPNRTRRWQPVLTHLARPKRA